MPRASARTQKGPPGTVAESAIPRRRLWTAALIPIVSTGLIAARAYFSPAFPLLLSSGEAKWIMHPVPLGIKAEWVTPQSHPPVSFINEFTIGHTPQNVVLDVRAMREMRLFLNGVPLPLEGKASANWKRWLSMDISRHLHVGNNEIRVEVQNSRGPAALQLRIRGLERPLATDETWTTSAGSSPDVRAIRADDTRPLPESLSAPTPLQFVRIKLLSLLLLFMVSAMAFVFGTRLSQRPALGWLPRLTLTALHVLWIYLFIHKWLRIPVAMGFDAQGHIEYINYILAHGRIPLLTDGWKMDQPPLFYLIGSAVLFALKPFLSGNAVLAAAILKALPFLSCLGNVWIAYALARKIFAGDPVKTSLAVCVAGLLPMNLYMSAYFSNEPLQSFLSGMAVLATTHLLLQPASRLRVYAVLGILLGLAALTRVTAILMLPLALFCAAWKLIFIEKAPARRVAKALGLLLCGLAAVSGWYFIRNLIHFGTPIVLYLEIPGQEWIQQPGFHTPGYYLAFGEALKHPYFSGFQSFWDALYSTCWGDGEIGGTDSWNRLLPPWNFQYMSIAFTLAVPATLVILFGYFQAIKKALMEPDPSVRLTLSFLAMIPFVLVLSMLAMTLRHPIYSLLKAYYGLLSLGPISVFAAIGFCEVDRLLSSPRLWPARAALYGWAGMLGAVICLSFAG